MLQFAIACLILAVMAGFAGFMGLASGFALLARVFFFLFLGLFGMAMTLRLYRSFRDR